MNVCVVFTLSFGLEVWNDRHALGVGFGAWHDWFWLIWIGLSVFSILLTPLLNVIWYYKCIQCMVDDHNFLPSSPLPFAPFPTFHILFKLHFKKNHHPEQKSLIEFILFLSIFFSNLRYVYSSFIILEKIFPLLSYSSQELSK